jgi:hypothetical protein
MKFIKTIKNKIKSAFEKTIHVHIYMKSGNVIVLDKLLIMNIHHPNQELVH